MTDPLREQAAKSSPSRQSKNKSTVIDAAADGTGTTNTASQDTLDATEVTRDDEEVDWFSPVQEASLLAEANDHKTEANALFTRGQANAALTAYETAVAVLPVYLYYDLAVLRSNMAACHLKLSSWQEAIRSATQAIEALDKKQKTRPVTDAKKTAEAAKVEEPNKKPAPVQDKIGGGGDDDDVEEEIVSEGAAKAARPPPPPPVQAPVKSTTMTATPPTEKDRLRIRAKALLRRGRARAELGGWANLAGAEEDYKALAAMAPGTLSEVDRRLVLKQIKELPTRTSAAKEEEMGDMMGKLKELGNGLLRPFGISTDNFQMVKDEKTGGYSMNFRQ